MKRTPRLPLLILVSAVLAALALTAGCADNSAQTQIAGIGDPPCLTTTTRAVAITETTVEIVAVEQPGGARTPCLTAPETAAAAGLKTQTVEDVAGDVQSAVSESPPAGLEALGDITRASLTVTEGELILAIRTAAALSSTTPAGVDCVCYSLALSLPDEASGGTTDCTYSVTQSDSRWSIAACARRAEEAESRQLSLDVRPVVSERTMYLVVPLSEVPDFVPSFSWGVESEWTQEGAGYSDVVPLVWFAP